MTGWRHVQWWHALALLVASVALVATASALDVHTTMASGNRITYFGLVVQGILNVSAGVLCYLAWRIGSVPAIGWLSSALLFLGLQDFPFLLSQFSDPQSPSLMHGEGAEVLAAVTLLLFFVLARQETALGRLDPGLIGVGAACLVTGVRSVLPHLPLLSDGFVDGTAWYERVAVFLACSAVVAAVVTNRRFPTPTRLVLTVVAFITGVQCFFDDAYTPAPAFASAAVSSVLVIAMGLLLLDAGIRALLDSLAQHQQAIEEVARRAVDAESRAQNGAELLHELRSTIGGLATASELLSTRPELSQHNRQRLERAMADQVQRVNRSLLQGSDQIQTFDVAQIVEPVVDLHRAAGQTITWAPPANPLPAWHVPDAFVQVLGTLLHNAARHANGRPVTITATTARGQVLLGVSQPGPAVDPTVRLFERGARSPSSPGQGLGLHVARRLMADHGGNVVLQQSSAQRTTFLITLPAAPRPQALWVPEQRAGTDATAQERL